MLVPRARSLASIALAVLTSCDVGDAQRPTDAASAGDREQPVWQPSPGTTWVWQLSGTIDTTPDVSAFDLDLFDAPDDTLTQLRDAGRVVICYFSAGSHEDWRADAAMFPESAIGSPLDQWPGERWLDIRDTGVRDVLAARLDLAVARGCDAVEPDNVDGWANATGFDLSADDQLDFNRWLADEAHARGLSVGLKNDLDQIDALEPSFDWALDEECMAFDECDALQPFIDAGKAVFHVEYVDDRDAVQARAAELCDEATERGFSTRVETWDLDGSGTACGE